MNRFGLHEQDFLKIYKSLNKEKFAEVILMSHLVCSGDKNNNLIKIKLIISKELLITCLKEKPWKIWAIF